jgi:predicted phosphodiesterase
MELLQSEENSDIHIAVVGCAHGELDLIYKSILAEEREKKCKIDLLICCGDFECARNDNDLLFVEGTLRYWNRLFWIHIVDLLWD